MNDTSSPSNLCETAAERVQIWFGKDRGSRLTMDSGGNLLPEFCKRHQCNAVKTHRVPQPVLHCHAMGKRKNQTQVRHIAKEGTPPEPLQMKIEDSYCNVNQKNMHLLSSQSNLSSGRVAWHNLKEYLLVSKKLKSLPRQSSHGSKFHHVVPIKSKQNLPCVQPLDTIREERHFHLDRVIRYFTI